jgi:hypothetical protein
MSAVDFVAFGCLTLSLALCLYSVRRYGGGGQPQFLDLGWVSLAFFGLGLLFGGAA